VGTGHGSSRPRSRSSTPTPTSWRTPCGPTSAPTASRPWWRSYAVSLA